MGTTVDEGNKLLTVTSACHDESSGDLRLFGLIYQVHHHVLATVILMLLLKVQVIVSLVSFFYGLSSLV